MKYVTFFLLVLSHLVYGQGCDPNLYSLKFDGTSSYVEINSADPFNFTSEITIEAWINASEWATTYAEGSIVCKHGWTQGESGYVIRAGGNGQLSFNIASLNQQGTFQGWKEVKSQVGALTLNKWYHVAGTFDGTKLKLYIDGKLVKSMNVKGSILPSPYTMKIGRIADDGATNKRYWNGLIDEVRIWGVARSEDDLITNMSNHISSTSPGLAGYWKFSEGSGDASVNATSTNSASLIYMNWNTDVPFTNGVQRPEINFSNGIFMSNFASGNQWNLNGVSIPGETNPVCVPAQEGYYSVTVDFGTGCMATSAQLFYASVDVAEIFPPEIKFFIHENQLMFYNLPNDWMEADFFLYDSNGKIILKDKIGNDGILLNNFSTGTYILSAIIKERKYSVKFFLD